jgi:hypothetical protein
METKSSVSAYYFPELGVKVPELKKLNRRHPNSNPKIHLSKISFYLSEKSLVPHLQIAEVFEVNCHSGHHHDAANKQNRRANRLRYMFGSRLYLDQHHSNSVRYSAQDTSLCLLCRARLTQPKAVQAHGRESESIDRRL